MQPTTHPSEFSYLVNLRGVSPEELAVKIKDGRLSVYGEHVERFKDANGAENLNLRGFSNEINLPSGIGTDELSFSICNDHILKIQTKKPCASAVPAVKNPCAELKPVRENVDHTSQSVSCPSALPPAGQPPKKPCCHASECPGRTQNARQAVAANTAPKPKRARG